MLRGLIYMAKIYGETRPNIYNVSRVTIAHVQKYTLDIVLTKRIHFKQHILYTV